MARHFKMLSASGSLIAIPLDQLSERLKKHGIKCNFFFISGIDGDLGVCEGTGRVCEEFFRPGPFPHSVVDAIEKEFNVEIVNEYDPRFWGCTSKEELAANVHKTEQRYNLLGTAHEASAETATSLQKKAISTRVCRALDIVEDRIEDELEDCWGYVFGVRCTALK